MQKIQGISKVLLFCALTLLLPYGIAHAALSEDYPTNGPFVTHLRFTYPGTLIAAGGPHTPAMGYFKLKNGADDTYHGGWIHVQGVYDNPPVPANIVTNFVYYPVGVSYIYSFVSNVPRSIRDKIHVDAYVISRPHLDASGTLSHTWPLPTTLGVIENGDDPLNPLPPVDSGAVRTLAFDPGAGIRWLDQDITLRLEVWFDSSIVDPATTNANERYVYEVPLRTIQMAYYQLSPYLVPIAIIGDPPGDQSWSSMTVTSGAGANLAITEGQSTTVTTDESFGFGPFTYQSPTETIFRETTQGIHQTVSVRAALGIRTNSSYGPGAGDVMVGLCRPTLEIYRALLDMEFEFIASGALCTRSFPMRELLFPQPGTPPALLTRDENAAFQALNPLLRDPRAVLREPRYYLIHDLAVSGGAISGALGIQTATRQQVETIVSHSSTSSNSQSVTVPLGAISEAAGSPLPVPDVGYRLTETTTASVEYKTSRTFEQSNGVLVEYEIADSDPTRWLWVQVYYDTYFRTFAFRDSSPRPGFLSIAELVEKFGLRTTPHRWKAIQSQETEEGANTFMVMGSLQEEARESRVAEFIPLDMSQPIHRVSVLPKTGNVLMPHMAPGTYATLLAKGMYTLSISEKGEVTFAPAGNTLEKDCFYNPNLQDLCDQALETAK